MIVVVVVGGGAAVLVRGGEMATGTFRFHGILVNPSVDQMQKVMIANDNLKSLQVIHTQMKTKWIDQER